MASIISGNAILFLFVALILQGIDADSNRRREIEIKGGPDSVVWVVQLSDLHFSVHHPDRARDFENFVGSVLSYINPSLVLITGDLTGLPLWLSLPFLLIISCFSGFSSFDFVCFCGFAVFFEGSDEMWMWAFFDFGNIRVFEVGIESMLAFSCLKGLNWRCYDACEMSLIKCFASQC